MSFTITKDISPEKISGYTYQGAPIVIGKKRGRPPKTKAKPTWYPIEKKVHAACLYAVTGNAVEVSRLTDIPVNQLKGMMAEQWWEDTIRQVRKEENDQITARMTTFINKGIDAIIDRLENGDTVLDLKTGALYKAPVRLKDISSPLGVVLEKRQLLRGEATARTERFSQEDILKELGSKFEAFAQRLGYKKEETIEGEVVDAETTELQGRV